jgi:hypothetical protein
MLVSATPIFAADTTTNVVLTADQTAKLDSAQTQLTELVAKIQTLKTTYKNTKAKGLLVALDQYEKQAKKLNSAINKYRENPTAPADRKIKMFTAKTKQLQWKVTATEKILKKYKTKVKKTSCL